MKKIEKIERKFKSSEQINALVVATNDLLTAQNLLFHEVLMSANNIDLEEEEAQAIAETKRVLSDAMEVAGDLVKLSLLNIIKQKLS